MPKIIVNTTGSPISITDTGVTVPASSNYTIPAQNYPEWAASSDVVGPVGSGTLVVNDGVTNLNASDGMALLQGEFPSKIKLLGDTDNTKIGNVGDRLKFVASDLPLPTGAATSALQTSGNASLSSIDGKLNSLGQKTMAGSVPVVLASDHTSVPVSIVSSIALSAPQTLLLDSNLVYSACQLVAAASASDDNPVMLIKNPSGSGKKLYILQASGNSTISNERTLFRVFRAPTVTANGTAITPQSRNVGGGAPASVIQTFDTPTVSSLGTVISNIQTGENTNSQDFADIYQLCLQPNNTLLITAKPKSNNRVQAITVVWYEVGV